MNTINQKNSTIKGNKDPRNQNQNTDDRSNLMNEELYDIDDVKKSDNDPREIGERGYTVRNGYNPNGPNPDQVVSNDDLDDLDDDFHTQRDLEDNEDAIYEVELEDENFDANGNDLNAINDEFDNPSDDFNETEEVLEDIDDEEDEEYIEEDVQEEDDEDAYPDNDPRKL